MQEKEEENESLRKTAGKEQRVTRIKLREINKENRGLKCHLNLTK